MDTFLNRAHSKKIQVFTSSPHYREFCPEICILNEFFQLEEVFSVFLFHSTFPLPSEFESSLGIPVDLYYSYIALVRPFDFHVYDFNKFLYEV